MKIRNFEIGAGRTFIIAELCSNIIRHLDNLPNIVKWCKESGADSCKIQLFKAESFPENERESKRRVEFPRERFKEFVNLCHAYDLAAGASVFDNGAVDLLVESGTDFIKLATRELYNGDLRKCAFSAKLPVISSFDSRKEWRYPIYENTVMMECTPEYPCHVPNISKSFDEEGGYGYSSHTSHWNDVIIAVSRGAIIVEKHVGFDKDDPEMGWSLYLDSFEQMVKDIRWVESVR